MSHADVWEKNGCKIEINPQWSKFGDWCNNQAKSSQHNDERDACKSFGGTGAVKWCTATPAANHKSYSDLIRINTKQANEINELKKSRAVPNTGGGVPRGVLRAWCTDKVYPLQKAYSMIRDAINVSVNQLYVECINLANQRH
jgi:hypothetical protein